MGLLATANANRRHFGLATTWVLHLAANTISLLFPEIYSVSDRLLALERRLNVQDHPEGALLRLTGDRLVRDNPDYLDYVAPAALAYIVSHPRFNIYRGKLGRLHLFGFGLDSIPHGATAYALSNMAYDTIAELEKNSSLSPRLEPYIKQLAARKRLVTAGFITLLTLLYELGEYGIHKAELKSRNYDRSRINMMWDVEDTVFDVLSNAIGWALSTWRDKRKGTCPGPARTACNSKFSPYSQDSGGFCS